MKLLLIEDEDFIRDLYKRQLELAGMPTDAFGLGNDGLNSAHQTPTAYDLVLLDIMLPDTNGLQILKDLKQNNDTKHIPVILLTNLSQDMLIKEGFELGAEGYLVKAAYTPAQIVQEVKNILAKKQSQSAVPQEATPTSPPPIQPLPTSATTEPLSTPPSSPMTAPTFTPDVTAAPTPTPTNPMMPAEPATPVASPAMTSTDAPITPPILPGSESSAPNATPAAVTTDPMMPSAPAMPDPTITQTTPPSDPLASPTPSSSTTPTEPTNPASPTPSNDPNNTHS
jgi:CheY-like chemotaxis protein